ncbi:MAG: hypothetical protein V4773_09945, partial [Verrucomicrobiota bacterium]
MSSAPFHFAFYRGFHALATLAFGLVASVAHAAEPSRLLVTNATVVTLAEGDNEPFTGYLLIGADGKIASLGRGAPPAGTAAAETLDAKGKIVMP